MRNKGSIASQIIMVVRARMSMEAQRAVPGNGGEGRGGGGGLVVLEKTERWDGLRRSRRLQKKEGRVSASFVSDLGRDDFLGFELLALCK